MAAKTKTTKTTKKTKTTAKPRAATKAKAAKPTPIPAGFNTLTPHLTVKGAARAIDFYKTAFGAKEKGRMPGPDGSSIMHASLQIGDSMLMLNDEFPEMGAKSPSSLNGSPVTVHLYVKNADAVFQRAISAGAKTIMQIQNTFWGDRYGVVVDPFGHMWSIASRIEILTPKAIAKRMEKSMQGAPELETADSMA
jgi:uncharacterized glyoxalase superfamily protein PhnB